MGAPGVASRLAAARALDRALKRGQAFDVALEAEAAGLSGRDRAYAHALGAMGLRRLGQIDDLLARFLKRPPPAKAGPAHALLRLAAADLLFLKTPPHAAIGATVAAAGADERARHFKALVNAVGRRLAREGGDIVATQDAARLATPDWLWESWRAAYGADAARAIAEAHLDPPALDLTVLKPGPGLADALEARALPTGTLRREFGGRVEDLAGYAEGMWQVQDAAAALPARLFGRLGGKRVLDLCAAPGGKTAQLAAMGALVTAIERNAARAARLGRNLARLGLTAEIEVADAASWRPPAPAEAVLLDAPCTASGAMRRHPDIAHRKRPGDVAALGEIQDQLLNGAAEMVAPGGLLVYCVCSLEPEEGPERVARLLASGAPFTREAVDAVALGGEAEWVTAEGELRTRPDHWREHGGLDGFYAARLRRSARDG